MVVVAKEGGDFTSVQAALDSITDATDSNRYLVWVAPGTYNEQVTMKEYVDIEGAGEPATKITSSGSTSSNTGTLLGADNAELRSLTVENTGGPRYATAIYNNSSSPRLLQVTAIASGAGTSGATQPVNVGVKNRSTGAGQLHSSPQMTSVTVSVPGGSRFVRNIGVFDEGAARPRIRNSVISTTGQPSGNWSVDNIGLYGELAVAGATVTLDNTKITGSTKTIDFTQGGTVRIGASQLDGGPVSGSVTCANVYDENYVAYTSTCPWPDAQRAEPGVSGDVCEADRRVRVVGCR